MKVREVFRQIQGAANMEIRLERVRDLDEGEELPKGAEEVDASTPNHDWKEVTDAEAKKRSASANAVPRLGGAAGATPLPASKKEGGS
jgi:hypothetical protein